MRFCVTGGADEIAHSRWGAVVTGATAGIGRDFAIQLAGAGFNVFLASRTASKLEEISAEIGACSHHVSRGWS